MMNMNQVYNNQITLESIMQFGKHKGKTFAQIADEDIDYLRWLLHKTDFFETHYVCDDVIDKLGDQNGTDKREDYCNSENS